MARWLTLLFVLALVALTSDQNRVRFVQPRDGARYLVLGFADIPIVTKVPPNAMNRWWALSWWGDDCAGSDVRDLKGEDSPMTQPEAIGEQKPYTIRSGPGRCGITAMVLDSQRKIIGRAMVSVCVGGECDQR